MQADLQSPRLPDRPQWSYEFSLLIIFAILTAGLAILAALNLLTDQGPMLWLKATLIGVAAGLVSFSVNRFAVERGAPQAARGFLLAFFVSISSVLIVGMGLFASTYAGFTINPVRELEMSEFGAELSTYVAEINEHVLQSERVLPVVDAAIAHIKAKRDCELNAGCLNANGIPGAGPTTRALDGLVERAEAIQSQLASAKSERQQSLSTINRLLGDYHSVLGESSKLLKARREQLIRITADLQQSASALKEALPVVLLQAYAQELNTGVTVPSRPVATDNVNRMLRKHGSGLERSLADLNTSDVQPPRFPPLAGVSSTFAYLGHFFPIGVLTAAVELVLPLALWIYTLMDCRWEIFQREQNDPRHSPKSQGSSKSTPRRRRGNQPLNQHSETHQNQKET